MPFNLTQFNHYVTEKRNGLGDDKGERETAGQLILLITKSLVVILKVLLMKMKNYTHYKSVYITSYPYVLLISFLHFSNQKALGREYNCKIFDPRGVGENCT